MESFIFVLKKKEVSCKSISFREPSLTLLTVLVIYSGSAYTIENTKGVQGGFQSFLFPSHIFHSEFSVEFRQETLDIFSLFEDSACGISPQRLLCQHIHAMEKTGGEKRK